MASSHPPIRQYLEERGLLPKGSSLTPARPRSHAASAASGGSLTKSRKTTFVPTGSVRRVALLSTTIPGDPRGKQRARVITGEDGTKHSYTPPETVLAEERIALAVNSRLNRRTPDPHGVYGVQCVFYLGNWRRRDVDNMQKLILDALNKIVWNDDWQVFETQARKDYSDLAHPRTVLTLYRLEWQSPQPPLLQ